MKKVWMIMVMIFIMTPMVYGDMELDWESDGLYGKEILEIGLKDHPYFDEMLLSDANGQQAFFKEGYLYYLNKKDDRLYRTDESGQIHDVIGPYDKYEKVYPRYWIMADQIYFQVAEPVKDYLYYAKIVSTDLEGHFTNEITKEYVYNSHLHLVEFYALGDHFFTYPQMDVDNFYFKILDPTGKVLKNRTIEKTGPFIGGYKGILPTSLGLVISNENEISFMDENLNERTLMKGRGMVVATLPDQPYAYIYKDQMLHIIHLETGKVKLHPMVRPMALFATNQKTGKVSIYTKDDFETKYYRSSGEDMKSDLSVGGNNVGGLYKTQEEIYFSAGETLYAFSEGQDLKVIDQMTGLTETQQGLYYFGRGDRYGYYYKTILEKSNTEISRSQDSPVSIVDGSPYEETSDTLEPGVFLVFSINQKGPEGVYYRDDSGKETLIVEKPVNGRSAFRPLYALEGYEVFEYGNVIYKVRTSDLKLEVLMSDVYTLQVMADTVLLSKVNNNHYHKYMYFFKNDQLIEVSKATFEALEKAVGGFDVSVNAKTSSGYYGSLQAGNYFFYTMKDGNIAAYDMINKSSKQLTWDFRNDKLFASQDKNTIYMTSRDDNYMYVYDIADNRLTQTFALGVDNVRDDGKDLIISGQMLPLNVVYEMDVQGNELTLREDYNRYRAFYDVPIEANVLNYQLMALRSAGLVTGSDGQALLDKSLTRAEAITLIVKMIEMTEGPIEMTSDMAFTDVSQDDWFHDFVSKATSLNLTSGVGNNLFDPYGKVTDTQFALMLGKLFYKDHGYQLPETYETMDWKATANQLSKTYELKSTTLVNKVITRAEAFGMLYKAYDFLDQTYFWFE